jgi:hypothetical protein
MPYAKTQMPKIKIILNNETYNLMMSVLHEWKIFGTENEKSNSFSRSAIALKTKIEKYSWVFPQSGQENVAIHFFENEAATMIELLIFSMWGRVAVDKNYFSELKSRSDFAKQN